MGIKGNAKCLAKYIGLYDPKKTTFQQKINLTILKTVDSPIEDLPVSTIGKGYTILDFRLPILD